MNKHKLITFEENKFWKYKYGDVSVMECYGMLRSEVKDEANEETK